MFKVKVMPGGCRLMERYRMPRFPVEMHSGILVDGKKRTTSDACTVYIERSFPRVRAYAYVRDHGSLIASGTASCVSWPWKSNRMKAVLKAFENAGIEFVRADGTQVEGRESDVMPAIVKDICKMVKRDGDEFVVVRRY